MHWIVYAMLFVNTVDTKIKVTNALNSVCYVVCRYCRYKDQSMQCIQCYILKHSIQTHPHIFAHNFLNIQLIFNLQKVLESWDWGLFNQYYMCQYCHHKTRVSNAFNAIYVDTVNTKHIYTFLKITFLIFNQFSICKKFWKAETEGFSTIPSILYMLTISTLGISISNVFNGIYVEAVDTFSTQCNIRSHPKSFLCICLHCQQTT